MSLKQNSKWTLVEKRISKIGISWPLLSRSPLTCVRPIRSAYITMVTNKRIEDKVKRVDERKARGPPFRCNQVEMVIACLDCCFWRSMLDISSSLATKHLLFLTKNMPADPVRKMLQQPRVLNRFSQACIFSFITWMISKH